MLSASDVLASQWDGSLPVKTRRIAEGLGIRVVADPFLDASGQVSISDGTPVIIYNNSEPLVRQRFTVAHEIGHLALGHLKGAKTLFRDPATNFSSASAGVEREANRFAADLLMPADVLRYSVVEDGITDVAELARLFNVSQVAMRYRLQNLDLI